MTPSNDLDAARHKFIKARAGLILDKQFFGSLALRLNAKQDPTCKTMWTDGRSIGYNPAYVNQLTLEQVKGVLAHEVMHVALQHATRMKKRNRGQYNRAADYVVNKIILENNFVLPGNPLLNDAYNGMSVEHVYSLLESPLPKDPSGPCSSNGSGGRDPDQDSGQDDQGEQPEDQSEDQLQDQDDPEDQPKDQPDPQPPEDKDEDKYEDEDPGGCGAIREAKFASPAEQAAFEQDWKIAVAQAAIAAKEAGNMPGGLDRVVGKILEPLTNWKEVLRRFVDQAMKGDYSWLRPNRRYLQSGFYLPSLHSEEIGHIVIAVDTSGSVDEEMLTQFASELTSIMEDYKTSCDILYCDTRIHKHQFVTSDDLPIKFEPCGYGGTDFRPPFKWVKDNQVTPVCLIYLTDMCCHAFPSEEPSYPVLWAQYEDECFASKAPFGETVLLKEK